MDSCVLFTSILNLHQRNQFVYINIVNPQKKLVIFCFFISDFGDFMQYGYNVCFNFTKLETKKFSVSVIILFIHLIKNNL